MKKFKLPRTILFTLFLISCANQSKNLVVKDNIDLKGGVFQKKEWREKLNFKRVSWYNGLTLIFDGQLAELTPNSQFYNWTSEYEKRTIANCSTFYVAMIYSLSRRKISENMFIQEMKRNGFVKIQLPEFHSNLRLHPDFEKFSLQLYDVFGFCNKLEKKKAISIRFPGFKETIFEEI